MPKRAYVMLSALGNLWVWFIKPQQPHVKIRSRLLGVKTIMVPDVVHTCLGKLTGRWRALDLKQDRK